MLLHPYSNSAPSPPKGIHYIAASLPMAWSFLMEEFMLKCTKALVEFLLWIQINRSGNLGSSRDRSIRVYLRWKLLHSLDKYITYLITSYNFAKFNEYSRKKQIGSMYYIKSLFYLSVSLGECTLEMHKLISTYSKCCSFSHGTQWGHLNLSEHLESIGCCTWELWTAIIWFLEQNNRNNWPWKAKEEWEGIGAHSLLEATFRH